MINQDLFFQFLNGYCHGNQFWAKMASMTFIRQTGVLKQIGRQFRFKNIKWQYCSYILCKFDQDEFRVTTAPFWMRRQKSSYPTDYLSNYWNDLHQIFSIDRHVYGNYLN